MWCVRCLPKRLCRVEGRMHLTERAHLLIVASAVLAIAGLWSDDPQLALLWCWPAAVLLAGLVWEGLLMRRLALSANVAAPARALLGRSQDAAFEFRNASGRRVSIEYAPALPLRCLGAGGLAWWTRELPVHRLIRIAPDSTTLIRARPYGHRMGLRARRALGAGSELYQLRAYASGDPLACIDWKATARSGVLITREYNEDQHLDIMIAIDAGRSSRVRAGRLDRLGLYANIAARFSRIATPHDDRGGLIVYAERTLAVCAPRGGVRAIARLHETLAGLDSQSRESDAVAAALHIRAVLKHRTLIIMLTDLDDPAADAPLARAVALLSPPHLVVVAAVQSPEIQHLARQSAHDWRDPWVALAALEHERGSGGRRLQLQQLGTPVIATAEGALQEAVFASYRRLRRRRRV